MNKEDIKKLPWYLKDRYGWPIEYYEGKIILSLTRIIIQNVMKIYYIGK
jgi:hypothetical protein